MNPRTPRLLPVALEARARVAACLRAHCSVNSRRRALSGRKNVMFFMLLPSYFFFFPPGKGWEEKAFAVGAEFICNNLTICQQRSDTSAVMRKCVPFLQPRKVKPKPEGPEDVPRPVTAGRSHRPRGGGHEPRAPGCATHCC